MFRLFLAFAAILITECACPTGYDDINGNCILFANDESLNWNDAREFCINNGSDPAIIKDCSFFGVLARNIHFSQMEFTEKGYWIGGFDVGNEGAWFWVDLESPMELGVPFWGTDEEGNFQPTYGEGEGCAMMYKNDQYYFHSQKCTAMGNPLCEYVPPYKREKRKRFA